MCPRSHSTQVVELAFESRASKLKAHALHSGAGVSTQKWPDMPQQQGRVSFLQSHFPPVTRHKKKVRATSTHHRMLVSKITLGYLLCSTGKYICIYAYTSTYIDIYTYTVYKHTNTHIYTYLHTYRVDTSPIWNSAIQRPHLSGTQPRNKEVSKKGI